MCIRDSARTILKNNQAEPKDMATIIFNCFKCSSTKDFNTLVENMAVNKKLKVTMSPEGVGNISADSSDAIDSFLQTLEGEYIEFLSNNEWEAKSTSKNQDSLFNANSNNIKTADSNTRRSKNIICFNCGKQGHGFPDCPEPLNQAKITANKEKFYASKRDNNDNSTYCSSCSISSSNSGNSNNTRNKDLSKIPPKPGMPNYRVLNKGRGPLVWWCQICGKWNEDHETKNHPTNDANNASEGGDDISRSDSSNHDTSDHAHSSDLGGFVQGSLGTPNFV